MEERTKARLVYGDCRREKGIDRDRPNELIDSQRHFMFPDWVHC